MEEAEARKRKLVARAAATLKDKKRAKEEATQAMKQEKLLRELASVWSRDGFRRRRPYDSSCQRGRHSHP